MTHASDCPQMKGNPLGDAIRFLWVEIAQLMMFLEGTRASERSRAIERVSELEK